MSRFDDRPEDIVPGLQLPPMQAESKPTPPFKRRSAKDSDLVAKIGIGIGVVFVAIVFLMLLAIVLIFLAGIAHALWGVFFG